MDTNQAKTFLSIVAHGSFVEAAKHLHVTQSTVSARMKTLEQELGASLFIRGRGGAQMSAAGRRFVRHAKALLLAIEQARHDVGLPGGFRATLRIGGRIALWEDFLPRWVAWMRDAAPDVSIRSEIGFEEALINALVEGTLDMGVMYTPRHNPGLVVEQLFDDTLILVSTRADDRTPHGNYVYVDWGPGFYANHRASCPDLERPAQSVNIGWLGLQIILAGGGSCFLPERMVQRLIEEGRLHRVPDSPSFTHPAYLVFPRDTQSDVLEMAVDGLRQLAHTNQASCRTGSLSDPGDHGERSAPGPTGC